jgi:anti-sigma B factor antagonist
VTEPTYGIRRIDSPGADHTVAVVTGELDAMNVNAFAAAIHDLPGERPIVLDLSDMCYLDSAGFAILDQLLATDTITVVLAPDSHLRKAAHLIGLPYKDSVD